MTRKPKKEQETYGNRKNHLKRYPFIFYIEGKNQTFIQSCRPFSSIFSTSYVVVKIFRKFNFFLYKSKKVCYNYRRNKT